MILWTVLRAVNVVLLGGILSGLIMHWRHLTVPQLPGFRWGLWGLVASLAYGTVEVVFLGQPGGPRLILVTISCAALFASCYAHTFRAWAARLRQHRRP